jgi:hypothetical protein
LLPVPAAKASLSLYAAERNMPLTVPHWYFGGAKFFPEARGWPELELYNLFMVKPDDTVTPLVDSGPPRSPLNEAATRAGWVQQGFTRFGYSETGMPYRLDPVGVGEHQGAGGTPDRWPS